MKIKAEKDGENTRLDIYLKEPSKTGNYIGIIKGEGKEDIYFTNTMSPFAGGYPEVPGKYIRVEKDRLVLYSKIKKGTLELHEKKTGKQDLVHKAEFSTSP